MAKRVAVKKKSASAPRKDWPKCGHKSCGKPSVYMRRVNGEPEHYCPTHWKEDVESRRQFTTALHKWQNSLEKKPKAKKKVVRVKK